MPELVSLVAYRGPTPLTGELEVNATELLTKVNSLLQELGVTAVTITSGYRTPEHNAKIGGAPNSKHCKAQAIDLADNDRAIGNRIMTNLGLLVKRGMSMEDLSYCETARGTRWVHLQVGLPPSGKHIFVPYAGPPKKR